MRKVLHILTKENDTDANEVVSRQHALPDCEVQTVNLAAGQPDYTGLLEKIYEICLVHELRKVGFGVARQLDIAIQYDGIVFDEGLRLDILVENKVIVEVKALDQVNPVWMAQVLSHLKLTGMRLGYLINFNVPLVRDGIKRGLKTLCLAP